MAKENRKKVSASQQGQTGKTNKTNKSEAAADQESLGADYWDRVAEDAASGYKNKEDKDSVLNEDQMPDDHERGDKTAEESQ